MNKAFQLIHEYEGKILQQNLDEECIWQIEIPARNYESLKKNMNNFYPIEIIEIK